MSRIEWDSNWDTNFLITHEKFVEKSMASDDIEESYHRRAFGADNIVS
jgi:hypothetical protein